MEEDSYDGVNKNKVKIFLLLLLIPAGFFLGFNSKTHTGALKKEFIECPSERPALDGERIKSGKLDKSKSLCLPYLPNKGMIFNRSQLETERILQSFFIATVRDEYDDPNEFNVHTNNSEAGSSAQKKDPRDDLHARFSKTSKFDPKVRYGMLSGVSDFKTVSAKSCEPLLNMIKPDEELDFKKTLLESRGIVDYSYMSKIENFSFLMRVVSLPYFRKEDILGRYKFFRNTCSNAITVPVNFCVPDPRYDLQYEDMFVLKNENRAVSNIYCKKSADKAWTLVKTHKFKLRSN